MIVLFTDFGIEGPYTGQVQARLQQLAPGVPVINVFSDLEPYDVEAAAYLLARVVKKLIRIEISTS